jgi:hypothetical protein
LAGRRTLVIQTVVVALALSSGAALASTVRPSAVQAAGQSLYPDLRTLPPRDLRFATVNVSSDPSSTRNSRVLQFSNTAYNLGEGHLDLRATIDQSLFPPSGPAVQRIHDSAGGWTDVTVGEMTYHAVHSHYHYDGWGRYELWSKAAWDAYLASGRTTTPQPMLGSKTTSCVLDEEFVQELSSTPYPGVHGSGGCQLDASGTLREGLAPGWGDTYDWYRFEQWIDLGGPTAKLADGSYVVRSVADPLNQLHESAGRADASRESEVANEAVTPLVVSGGQIVDTQTPSGSIALNGVARTTSSPSVTVTAVGRDDVSGVNALRLSNNGTAWSGILPYTTSGSAPTTLSWDLTDPRYGGTSAGGTKTVHAQFRDAAGRWGPITTGGIELVTQSTSGYATQVLADGPVGYWRLGDPTGSSTATDATGSNPGAYTAGVALGRPSLLSAHTDTAAKPGGNGAATVPDSASLRVSGRLTLETWFRPDSLPAAGQFASLLTKTEGYSLQLNGPRLEFTLINGSGTRTRLQAPDGAIAPGQTYHVVGTWDGTTQRLYLNGTQVASAARTLTVRTTSHPLRIGSWDGTANEALKGTLDEAAVYPTALTATQVQAHTTQGTGAPPPSPTASPTGPPAPTPTATPTATPTTSPTASPTASPTSSPPTTDYRTAVLADGPVGYWRLGDPTGSSTATDATGSNPGTYTAGVALGRPSLLSAHTDTAAKPGSNGAATVPDSASLRVSGRLTLETWFRPDSLPAAGQFASLLTKTEGYSLQLNGPRLEFTLINGSGTRTRLQAPDGAIAPGQTYHVVGTWDGTTQRLYLNGTQVASAARTLTVRTTSHPLRIGSWDGTANEVLKGTLDEAAVYPTALTATQVQAHTTQGTGTAVAPSATYSVTATVDGNGTGTVRSADGALSCPGSCTASYPPDRTVTLTATPASGSVFAGWGDGCAGTSPTCTVTTYAATTLTATFSASGTPATLSVTRVGSGSVTSDPSGIGCGTDCTMTVPVGTTVTLTAAPPPDGTFRTWAGACAGAATTCTLTVTRDTAVSATFEP